MTNTQDLDTLAHSTIYDSEGDKVGGVEQLYLDDQTQLPTWASVKTGWFGSASLVPLSGAKHSGDRIDVAFTKDKIKDAPHLDADEGISSSQQQELFDYYGINSQNAGFRGDDSTGNTAGETDAKGTTAGYAAGGTTGGYTTGTADQKDADYATGNRDADVDRKDYAADADRDRQPATNDDGSIVRSEEQLNVGTQRVEAGKARLRKYVVTEQQTVTVPVTRERVEVVREPITDGEVGNAEIGEGEAYVTLHEDQVVTDKQTVPVERVRLQVNEEKNEQTVTDSVRKEKFDVEGVDGTDGDKQFDEDRDNRR